MIVGMNFGSPLDGAGIKVRPNPLWGGSRSGRFRARFLHLLAKIRIQFGQAIRTNGVTEFSLGMLLEIILDALPVPLVVSHTFAGGANGQQTAQHLHFLQRGLQLANQFLLRFLGFLAFRDVAGDAQETSQFPSATEDGRHGQLHRIGGAILSDVGPLLFVGFTFLCLGGEDVESSFHWSSEFLRQGGSSCRHFFWVMQNSHILRADEFVLLVAESLQRARVQRQDGAGQISGNDCEVGAVQDRPLPFPRFFQNVGVKELRFHRSAGCFHLFVWEAKLAKEYVFTL